MSFLMGLDKLIWQAHLEKNENTQGTLRKPIEKKKHQVGEREKALLD